MQFAQNLKNIMDIKKITNYRLAKMLGVHQTTIKNWLDGKTTPSPQKIQAIAEALGVYESELVGIYTTTGHNIRSLREKQNMTQEELAEKSGKPISLIINYESGTVKERNIEDIKSIAKALGVLYVKLLYEPLQILTEEETNERQKIRNDEILSVVSQELEKGSKINWLIKDYVKLNSKGKFEANKRVGELAQIKEYTTPDEE